MFWTWLKLSHPSIVGLPWCVCTHPIDPIGIYFLCCTHGNERKWTHDLVCDIFAAIVQDINFHVEQE
jgi:hypothetical protein